MNCPRCEHELKVVKVNGSELDACQDGCGGIWFDLFELEKMDQPDESAGWLLENMRVDVTRDVDIAKPLDCPRCDGIKLMRQRYPHEQHIMIDKCPACGGTWLDFGELFEIRSSNPTTTEAKQATAAHILRGLPRHGQ
jgi:Zn-finger nucleic acid-binding protein